MRFDSYHPGLSLLFFAAAITFAVRWNQPVFAAIGWVGSLACAIALGGRRMLAFGAALVPCALAWALWVAANDHFGMTRIGTWVDGNALTLEAFAAGLSQGVAIATVLLWCSCALRVFTVDKVVYLVGRVAPKGALLLSVAARAVPVVGVRVRAIAQARRGVGRGRGPREAARVASAAVTWAADRFLETSASMRARGAGLSGRTAFSLFRFDDRDRALAIALVALVAVCACGEALDQTRILFDPIIVMNRVTPASGAFYAAYAALCLLPVVLQVAGEASFRLRAAAAFRR